jgi:hypothetical protein
MKKGKGKGWMFWTPRVLSILFILFLVLFSLDVFEPEVGFWQIVLGLLIHNLPSIVLLIILIVFWNKGIVPGVIFILAGLVYILDLAVGQWGWEMLSWIWIIVGPAWVIGILFILDWKKNKFKHSRS